MLGYNNHQLFFSFLAVTVSDIIDNHMLKMRENHQLLRHFSLYVLQGLLEASSTMHSKNWLHDDLHGKLIYFGRYHLMYKYSK